MERLQAVNEIQNQMSKYQTLGMARMYEEIVDLFAEKIAGVRVEIANIGIYEGIEGVRRFYPGMCSLSTKDGIGDMHVNPLANPVIEVAKDGKTAKGMWICPGLKCMVREGKMEATWNWLKYAVDFVKEDSKWKFWHFHMYRIFAAPYGKPWEEVVNAPIANSANFPDEFKPDRPNTYEWVYSPTRATENVPVPPEPYEIFDEGTAY